MSMKKCCYCGGENKRPKAAYCSKRCSTKHWQSKNLKREQEACKQWRDNNIEYRKQKQEEWRAKNPQYGKEYYEQNKEELLQKHKLRQREYRKDIEYRIKHSLRSRLNLAIKNNQKTGSAVKDLGCSIVKLKVHLESLFTEGMTWDNYGLHGWHIDHIKPLSKFDLSDREEFKKACNYTNLQPLWAKDNLKKSNK